MAFREWATVDALAHHFPLAGSLFHDYLFSTLGEMHLRRGVRLNVRAPRGSAKTTLATIAYPLYCANYGLEPFTVIISETATRAEEYLNTIRREVETNPRLAIRKSTSWTQGRLEMSNGAVIRAIGTGGNIRGSREQTTRPTLIVADDLQKLDAVYSALQRDKAWDWLTKDVMAAGTPQTNIVVLGTPLHRECIVCRLEKQPGWETKAFKAIVEMPTRLDLWEQWEEILHSWEDVDREAKAREFFEANREAMES